MCVILQRISDHYSAFLNRNLICNWYRKAHRWMSTSVIRPGSGGIQKPGTVESQPRILVKLQSAKPFRPCPNLRALMSIAEEKLHKTRIFEHYSPSTSIPCRASIVTRRISGKPTNAVGSSPSILSNRTTPKDSDLKPPAQSKGFSRVT